MARSSAHQFPGPFECRNPDSASAGSPANAAISLRRGRWVAYQVLVPDPQCGRAKLRQHLHRTVLEIPAGRRTRRGVPGHRGPAGAFWPLIDLAPRVSHRAAVPDHVHDPQVKGGTAAQAEGQRRVLAGIDDHAAAADRGDSGIGAGVIGHIFVQLGQELPAQGRRRRATAGTGPGQRWPAGGLPGPRQRCPIRQKRSRRPAARTGTPGTGRRSRSAHRPGRPFATGGRPHQPGRHQGTRRAAARAACCHCGRNPPGTRPAGGSRYFPARPVAGPRPRSDHHLTAGFMRRGGGRCRRGR